MSKKSNGKKELEIDEMEIEDLPSKENMEEEEEEDYVVQRFDVSLSHNLTENLYCFQYPLRTPEKGYDFNTLKEFRLKKEHKKIEIDFELNTKSEHYDTESSFDQKTFTLQSTEIPLKTNYCIGVLRGDQFHITPLKNILQLRPKLEYLNEDKHIQEKVTNKKKTTSQPRLVYATMQTKEDEENRKKSYEYIKQMEQSEPWQSLKFYPKNSIESSSMNEELFQKSYDTVKFDMPSEKYIDDLVQYEVEHKTGPKTFSMKELEKLDGSAQVVVCLMATKIMQYTRLKEVCKKAKSDEQILSQLENVGVLIDGRWIIKSESMQLPPKHILFRNYILSLLHKNKSVSRQEIQERTDLKMEQIKELLSDICEINKDKKWVLKLSPDEKFLKKYPEVVYEQEKLWDKKDQLISDNLNGMKSMKVGDKQTFDETIPNDLNEKLMTFFMSKFKQYGVCNLGLLKQTFAKEYGHLKKLISEDLYQTALDSISIPFGESGYCRKLLGDPNIDKYRNIVIDLFNEKSVLKKQEIFDGVEKRINEKIPVNVYSKITGELAIYSGKEWKRKTGSL